MLRLPRLAYARPATATEAAALVAASGGRALLIAGGTDLVPNLKRRQLDADLLVQVPPAAGIRCGANGEFIIGATATLSGLARHPQVLEALPGLAEAAGQVSSPPLRNAGTVGGNLCLDTRCNYYNQTQEWRRAIGFCMKRAGDICLVAPGSPRCWAVSSSDLAPVAMVLGATLVLVGPDDRREIPAAALYRDDGIAPLSREAHEVLTEVRVPAPAGGGSAYVKLRRRGSIDFPIAGAAVALRMEDDVVSACSIALSAVASHPLGCTEAASLLVGRRLTDESVLEAAGAAAKPARPLDNTDLNHAWRKRMVPHLVAQAIRLAASRSGREPSSSWQFHR